MVSNFRTDIDAWIDENLSAAARSKALGDLAISERTKLVQSGQASPHYSTTVDGKPDQNEYDVKGTGGGIINYHFSFLADALEFCLSFIQKRIYSTSGNLARSVWVSVNGEYYPPQSTVDYNNIPAGAELVIGNTAAYWRKADVNFVGTKMLRYHAPNVLNDCVSAVRREFGASAISAKRLADYDFPLKYKPVGGRRPYVYQSPVIVLKETS